MLKQSKVTVVLTSYNHGKYLHESIDSILHQTFSDFKLIIFDDGSIDDSWQIINSYSDPRIKAFQNKTNRHLDISLILPKISPGRYIAIHHSDDIWEPEKLEKQVAILDDHPEIGAVFTNAMIIGEQGEPLKDETNFYYSIFNQPNRSRFEWLNFFFYQGNALCHPSILIRQICYEKCGLYRNGLALLPDFDMWIRLCLKYEIHVLPEKLVRFRVRANEMNASANRPETRIRRQFEYLQVLNNFHRINTLEEFLKVFPNANKYFKPEGFDIGFALGMMALGPDVNNATQLFGLQLLFEALNDPDRAGKIKTLYGFSETDLFALTAKHDVFSIGAQMQVAEKGHQIQALTAEVAEKDQSMKALTAEVAEKDQSVKALLAQVAEIKSSTAWSIIQLLWRVRVFLAPHGSKRERFARILMQYLRRFRQRPKSETTGHEWVIKSFRIFANQGPIALLIKIYRKFFSTNVRNIDLHDDQHLIPDKKEYNGIITEDNFLQINGLPTPEKVDIVICVGPSNNISFCLKSIQSNTKSGSYSLHLIFHEDDAAFVTEFYRSNPNTHLYTHKMKLFNYAKANNLALRNCVSDVVLLNDDAEVTEGWLEKLKEDSKGVALTGAHTGYQQSGNPQMWGKGGVTTTKYPINMFCAYIPIRLRSIVGLLDEEFCYYGGDDVDYSCRALLNGFPLVISKAYVIHKDNQSYRESKELLIKESDKIIAERYGISSPFELSNIHPKVSLIMATRNRPELLKTAIKSILNMDYHNFELIIIDDNSNKKTSSMIYKYQEKDDRITSIRLPKKLGATKAREIGMKASKGQFILFSDDDDTVLPNRISSPLDFLLKNPNLDVVYCNYNLVYEGGVKPTFCEPFDLNAYLNLKFNIGAGILLGRRYAFMNVPFMSTYDQATDYDWVFRLVRQGYKIDLCPEIVMNYNRSGSPDRHLSGNIKSIKIHGEIHDRETLLKSVERH